MSSCGEDTPKSSRIPSTCFFSDTFACATRLARSPNLPCTGMRRSWCSAISRRCSSPSNAALSQSIAITLHALSLSSRARVWPPRPKVPSTNTRLRFSLDCGARCEIGVFLVLAALLTPSPCITSSSITDTWALVCCGGAVASSGPPASLAEVIRDLCRMKAKLALCGERPGWCQTP